MMNLVRTSPARTGVTEPAHDLLLACSPAPLCRGSGAQLTAAEKLPGVGDALLWLSLWRMGHLAGSNAAP